ncbi:MULTISPECIES: transposase [Flavobacteriaceae]|jgi:transposase|uniref:Transposase n=5 Tax=Flagellimonas TaxID=444459 RepID=A0A3A1NLQ4_9FLAO|nr:MULTISPECIES: transposase [Allomuricauda]MBO0324398.1 transposase [Muricauda sp. CAU 1633]MBO0356310.1 transposase [Allomuricauda aurea]MDF0718377.1 transposase [[Muricauda] yonaguniensis]MEE1963585.1 transposase [Allomuricauda taeanensis]MEE1963969.1 transposase [Allomuricauda taeanensis]
MTRRKFTPKFKTKVVLEALKERHSLAELAQKYEIHPTQISAWKRDFLDGAEQVFESGKKDARSETEREKDKLLKAIGQLKVENDFLKDALR